MLRIFATTAWSTAWSRSASAKTRNGALPPSSIDTRSRCCDACSISFLPTGVDPVNDTLRNRGSANSGPVTSPAFDVGTTCSTPSGRPASRRMSASISIDSGVSCAGFTIIVQPAAIAGPILRVPIAIGKFQGVISRHGPTGCRIVSNRPSPDGLADQRPAMRTASSANQRKNSAAYVTSAFDSATGLPISSVMSNARSSARSVSNSNARRRISPRSRGGVAAHAGWVSCAASSAAIASAAVASAISHSVSPVAGSSTANVVPPSDVPFGTRSTTARSRSALMFSNLRPAVCLARRRAVPGHGRCHRVARARSP